MYTYMCVCIYIYIYIYIHIKWIHFAGQQKLTQYCKSTICQKINLKNTHIKTYEYIKFF